MERPYVICHILSSLDGKINGPFMGTEAVGALGAEYGKYRTKMNADAWLYGTTTTKEFTGFRKPVLEKAGKVPDGDFVADDRAELYYVSVDVDGEIGWESGIYALYITLPGYGAYYFQGVAVNLKMEHFAEEAKKYNEEMIIVAPQPDDWGETSKRQTIGLTEYMLAAYNIDPDMVYISGYSGGGETLSLAVSERPELYTAALHVSSKWDGDLDKVAEAGTPVYCAIGESDEYYGSEPAGNAYGELVALYERAGFSREAIDSLAVLDVKNSSYFSDRGMSNQHGGGGLFAEDEAIMGWLFGTHAGLFSSGEIRTKSLR